MDTTMVNAYGRRSIQNLTHGFSAMSSYSHEPSSSANNTFKHPGSTKYISTSFRHEEFTNFIVPKVIRALKYHTIIMGNTSPMRFSSLASGPKPDLGQDNNNEQVANPILKRSWAMLLGIGAAWAKKLVQRKNEFADMLKRYWLDIKIGSRLLVKLAVGSSLSRTDRHQLTKLLGIVPRCRGMLSSLSLSHP